MLRYYGYSKLELHYQAEQFETIASIFEISFLFDPCGVKNLTFDLSLRTTKRYVGDKSNNIFSESLGLLTRGNCWYSLTKLNKLKHF